MAVVRNLLFVANYTSDTGYAWRTIEQVFRKTADRLAADGVRSAVCYPSLEQRTQGTLPDSNIPVFEFDYSRTAQLAGARAFARILRAKGIHVLYLTDQPTWSLRYLLFRHAGVRRILVHDRTSGGRHRRGWLLQALKRGLHAARPLAVDLAIAVSDFVAERLARVNGVPRSRVVRVYNGIDFAPYDRPPRTSLHQILELPSSTRFVFASGRAMPYKGIPVLLEAARILEQSGSGNLHFAFAGDGPALASFRATAERLEVAQFHFLGRRSDIPDLLRSATVAAVPSVWEEAFGLTVVEAMAAGLPVVATRTGGIPELVEDGVTGLLVPPGDAPRLAAAIRTCLDNPTAAAAMGRKAAVVARERFSLDRVAGEIAAAIRSLD